MQATYATGKGVLCTAIHFMSYAPASCSMAVQLLLLLLLLLLGWQLQRIACARPERLYAGERQHHYCACMSLSAQQDCQGLHMSGSSQ